MKAIPPIVSTALAERRQADDDLAQSAGLLVDPVHQDPRCARCRSGRISESFCAWREHLAAQVEHHALVDGGREVLVAAPSRAAVQQPSAASSPRRRGRSGRRSSTPEDRRHPARAARLSPMMLSTTKASGHGSGGARAVTAITTVTITEMIAKTAIRPQVGQRSRQQLPSRRSAPRRGARPIRSSVAASSAADAPAIGFGSSLTVADRQAPVSVPGSRRARTAPWATLRTGDSSTTATGGASTEPAAMAATATASRPTRGRLRMRIWTKPSGWLLVCRSPKANVLSSSRAS